MSSLILNHSKRNSAFTIVEFMMAATVAFTISSVVIGTLHYGFRKSLQARCMQNMRTLWQTSKNFRIDNRNRYPSEYPNTDLRQLFIDDYDIAEGTFTCVEYEPPMSKEEVSASTSGQAHGQGRGVGLRGRGADVEDVSEDVYSNFYIMMRDLAPSDTPFLTCPYHDENSVAVTITMQGRAFSHERFVLIDGEGDEIEPLTELNSVTIDIWDNGNLRLEDGITMSFTGTYQDGDTKVINMRMEEDSTGHLFIKLPANSRLHLLSSAGLMIFESNADGFFNFEALFTDTSGYKGVAIGSGDHIQVFGRYLSINSD